MIARVRDASVDALELNWSLDRGRMPGNDQELLGWRNDDQKCRKSKHAIAPCLPEIASMPLRSHVWSQLRFVVFSCQKIHQTRKRDTCDCRLFLFHRRLVMLHQNGNVLH